MPERLWTQTEGSLVPDNKTIKRADLEVWNTDIAQLFGFPNLMPEAKGQDFFDVAVGRNAEGKIVGAYLLQSTKDKNLGERADALRFLSMRAQQVFGIYIRSEAEDR